MTQSARINFTQTGAEKSDERDRQQKSGKSEKNIKNIARQNFIDPAAVKSGDRADDHADERRNGDDDNPDLKRNSRAENETRKNVAAERVRAEPMFSRRRGVAHRDILRRRIVRGDKRRENRRED